MRIMLLAAIAALAVGDQVLAQTALCRDPGTFCGKVVSADCLDRFGAGPIAAAEADCVGQLTNYRDCVAQAAQDCGGQPAGAGGACDSATALALWASAEKDNNCVGYQAYRSACPKSPQARFVAARMQTLGCGGADDAPAALKPMAADPPIDVQPQVNMARAAQRELKRLGLYSGSIDGEWGPASTWAMRRFQQQAGRPVTDGLLHEASLEALKAAPTPEPREPAAASAGRTFRDCAVCPEMVVIPSGSFRMGSNDGADDEKPVHSVSVSGYALGLTEVTFAEWDACVADGGCSGFRPNDENMGRGSRPVIKVSWYDAQSYVSWLNRKIGAPAYRLPSEAEWEYAARAGSSAKFSFGDSEKSLGDHAWFSENSGGTTHPVGGKTANVFGLHDMHGNVYEWVQDCLNSSYSNAPTDGSAWLSGDCDKAVLRGGSWFDYPGYLRSASRFRYQRDVRSYLSGFRVARTLTAGALQARGRGRIEQGAAAACA